MTIYTDDEAVKMLNEIFPAGLKLMSAKCIAASNAEKSIVVEYYLDDRFANGVGQICGGYLANALDQAACYAMSVQTGNPAPTLEIKVSFVSAMQPGRLEVTGRVLKSGKTFGFVEAIARDDQGHLVATASATVQQISLDKIAQPRQQR